MRKTRRQQIRGAFKVTSRERVKGREILLVDDVLTTGATASECARELRQAGARRVWVATPARALGRAAISSSRAESALEARCSLQQSGRSSVRSVSLSFDPFSPGTAQGSLLQRRGIPSTYGEQRVGGRALRARLL